MEDWTEIPSGFISLWFQSPIIVLVMTINVLDYEFCFCHVKHFSTVSSKETILNALESVVKNTVRFFITSTMYIMLYILRAVVSYTPLVAVAQHDHSWSKYRISKPLISTAPKTGVT